MDEDIKRMIKMSEQLTHIFGDDIDDECEEYKCTGGHDLCNTMYPKKECPYCELKSPNVPNDEVKP